MNTTELTYPVFKANQVLTDAPLNDMFEYLDEQTRLTRANLIGVGIACGLEAELSARGTIHLTKGCGITTQGYLVVEPKDVDLVAVRKYELPDQYGYAPFVNPAPPPGKQHELWELFPAVTDTPGAQLLTHSGLDLDQMAVVLFLELREDGMRNCSPSSCDDRGAQVSATVRRLLIDAGDLDKVIASTSGPAAGVVVDPRTVIGEGLRLSDLATAHFDVRIGGPLSPESVIAGRSGIVAGVAADPRAVIADRLKLPDVRIPRFDVPNSGPVSPESVLAAFQEAFRQTNLVAATASALKALYDAFKPLVVDEYPVNPFATFVNRFGFLDASPVTSAQVRFMQYYWDLFDDLLAAYDEMRWKGVDLMCACCPPEGLFPRHLMAGPLGLTRHTDPGRYRHHFVRSPAADDCEDRTRQVLVLFRRLVAMVNSFTETPLTPVTTAAGPDPQIRITPSRWGDVPLSAKAIPYYYRQDGKPRLYELWDPEKTARKRADQNLGYRAGEYQPPPPPFVSDPLRFDLEPHDFLRIEGHLGKNVQQVLRTLLSLKKSHRLPIEIVALRAGAFDENIDVDLSQEQCRFEDLDTLYETLRSELICFLVKQIRYFYDLPRGLVAVAGEPIVPSLPLLRAGAPEFRVRPGTMGRFIESILTWKPGEPGLGVLVGPADIGHHISAIVAAISELTTRLTDDVRRLDFTAFADRYRHLVDVATQFESARREGVFNEPGLEDRLDDIVFRCRLDPFETLAAEYKRRLRDAKQAQFLSHFLEHHPGVQHKAGVPLGGTFVLVYHELPAAPPGPATGFLPYLEILSNPGATPTFIARTMAPETAPDTDLDHSNALAADTELLLNAVPEARVVAQPTGVMAGQGLSAAASMEVREAFARLPYKTLAEDSDIQLIYQTLTGNVLVPRPAPSRTAVSTYVKAIGELASGTVIADFFLPYQCNSDCSPIQYTLPPVHLRVVAIKACTNPDGLAEVTLAVDGATGSVSVQVDDGPFEESTGTLLLGVGDHTIVVRDDTGAQSSPVEVTIPPELTIGGADRIVDEPADTWHITFAVAGGTAPYVANIGEVVGATYTSPAMRLEEILTVTVTDAAGCTTGGTFESGVEPCTLPCEGAAEQRGYRFWVPEAQFNFPLNEYRAEVHEFVIVDPNGDRIDLTDAIRGIVESGPNPIPSTAFPGVVERWLRSINDLVADAVGSDQWLNLAYEVAEEGATTGTLWVDRIACLDFTFRLDVTFVQGRRDHAFTVEYDAGGTLVTDHITDSVAQVPSFGGSTSNKCRPWEPAVPLCDGSEMELMIEREGTSPDLVVLRAVASEEPAAYLWEMQDGIPSLANGREVAFVFEAREPVEKRVRLTAFTDEGCVTVLEQVVNIFEQDG